MSVRRGLFIGPWMGRTSWATSSSSSLFPTSAATIIAGSTPATPILTRNIYRRLQDQLYARYRSRSSRMKRAQSLRFFSSAFRLSWKFHAREMLPLPERRPSIQFYRERNAGCLQWATLTRLRACSKFGDNDYADPVTRQRDDSDSDRSAGCQIR